MYCENRVNMDSLVYIVNFIELLYHLYLPLLS